MSRAKCSCETLERLEGASVPAYISAYLDQITRVASEEKSRYRCRVCGVEWEKSAPQDKSEGKRPSLIRQK
jgi:hypothetical protein